MADTAQLCRLVAFNQWANEKILGAIDGMTAAYDPSCRGGSYRVLERPFLRLKTRFTYVHTDR